VNSAAVPGSFLPFGHQVPPLAHSCNASSLEKGKPMAANETAALVIEAAQALFRSAQWMK
jgi:hypothetical protein